MTKIDERYERDFDSLGSLPGGSINYLNIIEEVLREVSTRPHPTIVDVARALSKERVIAERSMDDYLQLLQRMSLIVRHHDESVTLTPLARNLLQASSAEERARLMIEMLLRHCAGMAEVLVLYENASRALTLKDVQAALTPHFPNWNDATNYKQRILWLMALKCLVKTGTRHSSISEFGRQALHAFAPPLEAIVVDEAQVDGKTPDDLDTTSIIDESEDMIDELQAASTASDYHRRIEEATAVCTTFVGYDTNLRGDPGLAVPDLIITSRLPGSSYRVVIDTKSRANGHLAEMEMLTLVEYRIQNNADYAVVVAGSFADGKMVRHAQQEGVVLLTVEALSDWVRLHAATPLPLAEYEAIFKVGGIVESLPESVLKAAEQQRRWSELMALILYFLQDAYRKGLDIALLPEHLQIMLFSRLDEQRFTVDEIKTVVNLLCSPVNDCFAKNEQGAVILRMGHDTLMRRMRRLADLFEACYEDLAKGRCTDKGSSSA